MQVSLSVNRSSWHEPTPGEWGLLFRWPLRAVFSEATGLSVSLVSSLDLCCPFCCGQPSVLPSPSANVCPPPPLPIQLQLCLKQST